MAVREGGYVISENTDILHKPNSAYLETKGMFHSYHYGSKCSLFVKCKLMFRNPQPETMAYKWSQ